ncbi:MAG: hypothetical protein AAGD05_09590, partial [Bacteroidota bacterium]
ADIPGEVGFFYRYYLPQMSFFVVEQRGGSNGGYRLVNDKSGREISLRGFPKASPNFKHLLVASTDLVPQTTAFGLRMYGYTPEGFQIIWEKNLEDHQPVMIQWIDDQTAAISMRPLSVQDDPIQIFTLQQQADQTWQLLDE